MKIKKIIEIVSEFYDMSIEEILSKSNKRHIVLPRQICHYFARKYTKYSLATIAYEIGSKTHGTVLHSDKVIEDLLTYDKVLIAEIDDLDRQIASALRNNVNSVTRQFDGYTETTHFSKGFLKK